MVSIARGIDRAVGRLSRLLHLRRTQTNTVGDLAPYLDAPADVLFPAPAPPPSVVRRRAWQFGPRALVAETLDVESPHVPLCPRYRLRHVREYAPNGRFRARWIHPRSGPRRRALVYVHGWLESGPWLEEATILPRVSGALGVDLLDLHLPFHGRRNPPSALFQGELFLTADLVRSIEAIRQSVTDVRALVAWLREGGYEEVGVVGMSLGASITMILACLVPTPDYVVPIMGHLQLCSAVDGSPLLWRMRDDLERFGVDRARCRAIFERLGLEKLQPVLSARRQLWIMAREDRFVLASDVEAQWRRWGRPSIEWLPRGHMTFPLSLGRIVERTRAFHDGLVAEAGGSA